MYFPQLHDIILHSCDFIILVHNSVNFKQMLTNNAMVQYLHVITLKYVPKQQTYLVRSVSLHIQTHIRRCID